LDALEVDIGMLWSLDPTRELLRHSVTKFRSSTENLESFVKKTQSLHFACGESLPGRVWKEGGPVWHTDIAAEPNLRRREPATRSQLRSALAFPIQSP